MSGDENLLEIPSFLRRPKKRRRRKKIKPVPLTISPKEIKLPPGDWKLHRLHLKDELPRLGSGVRLVYLWEGRKWAHIISRDNGKRAKIRLSILKTLKSEPMENSNV